MFAQFIVEYNLTLIVTIRGQASNEYSQDNSRSWKFKILKNSSYPTLL